MDTQKIHKLALAEIQLHRAILVFLNDKDFPSAATLAGAAEEILGKYVLKAGGKPSVEDLLDRIENQPETEGLSRKVLRDTFLNGTKNLLKHHGDTAEDHIERVWQTEAINLIFRGSMNYRALAGTYSDHIRLFLKYIRSERPDLYNNLDQDGMKKFDTAVDGP